jgi:phosphate transport system permease protein
MAAVPSVVYGLWGFFLLQGQVLGAGPLAVDLVRLVPALLRGRRGPARPAGDRDGLHLLDLHRRLVVGLMVTPLACSVMREVFQQAPVGEREGALALGRHPLGDDPLRRPAVRQGRIIGGTMLSLGRALGETIAVFLIISPVFVVQPNILQNGTSSVSSLIALQYGAATPFGTSALMAAAWRCSCSPSS